MISKKALEEFKKIYKEEFGSDISDEEALEKATNLLNLFRVIYKPIRKDWIKDKEDTKKAVDEAAERLAEIMIAQIELERATKENE